MERIYGSYIRAYSDYIPRYMSDDSIVVMVAMEEDGEDIWQLYRRI